MTESLSFHIQFCFFHASFPGMKEYCDVLCDNYVDLASIYQIIPQIQPDPDPDPDTLDPAGSGSKPDPPNSPDIRPDPDLDPVHPYIIQVFLEMSINIMCDSITLPYYE